MRLLRGQALQLLLAQVAQVAQVLAQTVLLVEQVVLAPL
jgi:hypothetical protein